MAMVWTQLPLLAVPPTPTPARARARARPSRKVPSVLPGPETQAHMCPGMVSFIKGVRSQRSGEMDKEEAEICTEHEIV